MYSSSAQAFKSVVGEAMSYSHGAHSAWGAILPESVESPLDADMDQLYFPARSDSFASSAMLGDDCWGPVEHNRLPSCDLQSPSVEGGDGAEGVDPLHVPMAGFDEEAEELASIGAALTQPRIANDSARNCQPLSSEDECAPQTARRLFNGGELPKITPFKNPSQNPHTADASASVMLMFDGSQHKQVTQKGLSINVNAATQNAVQSTSPTQQRQRQYGKAPTQPNHYAGQSVSPYPPQTPSTSNSGAAVAHLPCTRSGRVVPTLVTAGTPTGDGSFPGGDPVSSDWSFPAIEGLQQWMVMSKTGRNVLHAWTSAIDENQPEDTEWYKTSVYTFSIRADFAPGYCTTGPDGLDEDRDFELELELIGHDDHVLVSDALKFHKSAISKLKRRSPVTFLAKIGPFSPMKFSFVHNGKHVPYRFRIVIREMRLGRCVAQYESLSPPLFLKSKKPKGSVSIHEAAKTKKRHSPTDDADAAFAAAVEEDDDGAGGRSDARAEDDMMMMMAIQPPPRKMTRMVNVAATQPYVVHPQQSPMHLQGQGGVMNNPFHLQLPPVQLQPAHIQHMQMSPMHDMTRYHH
jgi:hypothetical protein